MAPFAAMSTIQARFDAAADRYRTWWEPVLAPTALALLNEIALPSAGADAEVPHSGLGATEPGPGAARILDLGTGAGLADGERDDGPGVEPDHLFGFVHDDQLAGLHELPPSSGSPWAAGAFRAAVYSLYHARTSSRESSHRSAVSAPTTWNLNFW